MCNDVVEDETCLSIQRLDPYYSIVGHNPRRSVPQELFTYYFSLQTLLIINYLFTTDDSEHARAPVERE